jgi:hypothetical protein
VAVDRGQERHLFSTTLDPHSAEAHRWQERTLPLGDLAGRTVGFVFRARTAGDGRSIPCAPIASVSMAPTDPPRQASTHSPPGLSSSPTPGQYGPRRVDPTCRCSPRGIPVSTASRTF